MTSDSQPLVFLIQHLNKLKESFGACRDGVQTDRGERGMLNHIFPFLQLMFWCRH